MENKLYDVELKAMHNRAGYVIISAEPMCFEASIETLIVHQKVYQVKVIFGNKTIYFDPKDGGGYSSRTIKGVVKVLRSRDDVENIDLVVEQFIIRAKQLIAQMKEDGYTF